MRVTRPRPSPRILSDDVERRTAMDFEVEIDACGRRFEGSVSLFVVDRETSRWTPCRSLQWDRDAGWMHGNIKHGINAIRTTFGPRGGLLARRVVDVLSGSAWLDHHKIWAVAPEAITAPEVDVEIDVESTDPIIPGDVIIHHGSGRIGSVLAIGHVHRDVNVKYQIRPSVDLDQDPRCHWWSSTQVYRAAVRDPYRRYLAMCDAEDDAHRRARRSAHQRYRSGEYLPEAAWNKVFWRLVNLRRSGPDGMLCHHDLGRQHWEAAANDCLDRRDRSRPPSLR